MKPMHIRPYNPKDAPSLCAVFFDAVRLTGLRDYSEVQVKAWAHEIPSPADFEARAGDGRIVLVAVDDQDNPVAYGDLETNGHIDHLYCRPALAGTGTASVLYDQIEQKARELEITRLFVDASESARRLFLKKGFTELKRHEFLLRGIAIHNYLMEKWLSAAGE